MNIRKTSLGLPAALLATLMFGACQNTARGIQQDRENNTEKAKAASQDAANATARATQDLKQAAEKAADATKIVAEKTAEATKDVAVSTAAVMDAAAQTMLVKTALIADKSVEAEDINVDTDGTAKVVTLKGSVPTSAQRAAAGRIAKEKAPNYRIVNNLVVKP